MEQTLVSSIPVITPQTVPVFNTEEDVLIDIVTQQNVAVDIATMIVLLNKRVNLFVFL